MEGLEYNIIKGFPTNVQEHLERSLSQWTKIKFKVRLFAKSLPCKICAN